MGKITISYDLNSICKLRGNLTKTQMYLSYNVTLTLLSLLRVPM